MVDRATYDEAKRLLKQISHELDTQPLTPEQREELELHVTRLSGLLLSPWLPVSWSRRLVMAAIVLFGLQQAWTSNYEPLVFWLLLPAFSPRIMGTCFYYAGRLAALFR
jgi:hypothetical protein